MEQSIRNRDDCKYQGTALDLINRATDAKDYRWFDGYFEKNLAHDPKFLRELIFNIGKASKDEVFGIRLMLIRLFQP